MVNIGASVLTTVLATELFGHESLGIVTGVLTLTVLIFGEIIPKTFCHKYAETFALVAALPLIILGKLLFPFIWLIEKFISAINRYFKNPHRKEGVVTEEELQAMVDLSAEEGTLEASEAEMIEGAMEFGGILAHQVMTPRAEISGIDENRSVRDALETMINQGLHSRLPVYKEILDHPVGVVTMREICRLYLDPHTVDKPLRELRMSSPIVVPTTQPIQKLYHQFRVKKSHLALVMDENGTVVGLVTMEDIIEEVMGEIQDETDLGELDRITRLGEKSWSLSGDTELKDFEKASGIWLGGTSIGASEDEKRKSLSLLFIENFQRVPKVGKSVSVNDCELTVEIMDRFKIARIRVDKKNES